MNSGLLDWEGRSSPSTCVMAVHHGTLCIRHILLKTEPSTPSPSWEGVASWIGHRDTRFRCLSVVLHCQVACSRLNPSTLPAQGRAFNTFPLMGDVWVPAEILEMKPLAKNFFENTATVQVGYREGGGGKLGGMLKRRQVEEGGGFTSCFPPIMPSARLPHSNLRRSGASYLLPVVLSMARSMEQHQPLQYEQILQRTICP